TVFRSRDRGIAQQLVPWGRRCRYKPTLGLHVHEPGRDGAALRWKRLGDIDVETATWSADIASDVLRETVFRKVDQPVGEFGLVNVDDREAVAAALQRDACIRPL